MCIKNFKINFSLCIIVKDVFRPFLWRGDRAEPCEESQKKWDSTWPPEGLWMYCVSVKGQKWVCYFEATLYHRGQGACKTYCILLCTFSPFSFPGREIPTLFHTTFIQGFS